MTADHPEDSMGGPNRRPDDSQPPARGGARELAAELLVRTRPAGPFIADLFDELADRSGLDRRDRHLAHELAAGVTRHRRTLDLVLNAFTRRPLVKSPPPLRVLVRLGAYQLLFLDRVPDYAAVDQTVELAKQWARPRMKKHPASIGGYVNGLLRAVASARQELKVPPQSEIRLPNPKSGCPIPSPRRLIERPASDTCVLLDRDVFADPQASPGEFLADAYSFDPWLAGRWVTRFGLDKARDLARAQNRRAGLTIRVNTLRTTADAVRDMLAGEGVNVRAVRPGLPLLRVLDGDALNSKAMQLGLIQPQDPVAAAIVPILDVRPGLTVLDRCAAPGTKTTQIVELMQDKGRVLAVGVDDAGLERVMTNVRRMGGHIVQVMHAEEMPARLLAVERIDRVLVDAPCTNSGVLARRPEARWRINAESMVPLSHQQRELLMDALNWVSPGGKVLYATCSIEPEENEQVVQYAINRRRGQARLLDERMTLPSLADDHDGGYWALLERVR